jgi:hypothetical protein
MNDETKRKALNEITQDINTSRLSRRGLLNRLKGLGVAFGAAVMLGVKESEAHNGPAATARLKSTNNALNDIIEEDARAHPGGEGEERPVQSAFYRVFRRVYRRFFRRW